MGGTGSPERWRGRGKGELWDFGQVMGAPRTSSPPSAKWEHESSSAGTMEWRNLRKATGVRHREVLTECHPSPR